MIVKTGANYQAEGGYIEFAINGKYTVVGDTKIPTYTNRNSISIIGVMSVPVRKAAGMGTISILEYPVITTTGEGAPLRDMRTYTLTETARNISVPMTFGAKITAPSGAVPSLASGSRNVVILRVEGNYYLFITGENPAAVITYSEG